MKKKKAVNQSKAEVQRTLAVTVWNQAFYQSKHLWCIHSSLSALVSVGKIQMAPETLEALKFTAQQVEARVIQQAIALFKRGA